MAPSSPSVRLPEGSVANPSAGDAEQPIASLRAKAESGRAPRPFFTRFAQEVSRYAGKPATFVCAVAIILIWGATGPMFGYDDTWQLIINTSTTIVTFLMVFLIQNSQNRDTAALQIKLDELIARTEGPRNALLDLEDLDEVTLEKLRLEYALLADRAREQGRDNPGKAVGDAAILRTAEAGVEGELEAVEAGPKESKASAGSFGGGRKVAVGDCPEVP
ncbi:low affinity iron permease family protein [Xanthobacter sp. DSM 24535]|uniref:low affinity iron permease family protein n=1 Tax=Roseixanthobacter psychrophilus TaxID=3119917 RepID=UPI00372CB472